jgi:DNA mismatch endonuclease (patch repair protein)
MADFLTKKERSLLMSKIRSKDTKPELAMAALLRRSGIGFSRYGKVPGTPDFVLRKKIAVFVDGRFWHGRDFASWKHKLKPFWREKIENNIRRDRRVNAQLWRAGWSVIRVWEDRLGKGLRRIVRKMATKNVDSRRTMCYNGGAKER